MRVAPVREPTVADSLRRLDRVAVVGGALAITLLSWALLATAHDPSGVVPAAVRPHVMSGVRGVAAATAMWLTMMVAMMVPPALPWIALFARARRDRDGRQPFGDTTIFVAGYFSVWAAFCAVAALVQVTIGAGALGEPGAVGVRAGGAMLVLAGLYQFSPLKAACLRHCRNPLGFLLRRWSDGPAGAWHMGASHGLYCLGCCWALMALAFAVGVMNLVWMAGLTVMLSIETVAPIGRGFGRACGVALIAWGSRLLVA